MSLKEQITEDMKAAMRAKDSGRLATIRLLTAAIKQKEVDERPQDMGKVMGVLKPRLAGRADMTAVSAMVKAALTK